jgi:hypothetical protein
MKTPEASHSESVMAEPVPLHVVPCTWSHVHLGSWSKPLTLFSLVFPILPHCTPVSSSPIHLFTACGSLLSILYPPSVVPCSCFLVFLARPRFSFMVVCRSLHSTDCNHSLNISTMCHHLSNSPVPPTGLGRKSSFLTQGPYPQPCMSCPHGLTMLQPLFSV